MLNDESTVSALRSNFKRCSIILIINWRTRYIMNGHGRENGFCANLQLKIVALHHKKNLAFSLE